MLLGDAVPRPPRRQRRRILRLHDDWRLGEQQPTHARARGARLAGRHARVSDIRRQLYEDGYGRRAGPLLPGAPVRLRGAVVPLAEPAASRRPLRRPPHCRRIRVRTGRVLTPRTRTRGPRPRPRPHRRPRHRSRSCRRCSDGVRSSGRSGGPGSCRSGGVSVRATGWGGLVRGG